MRLRNISSLNREVTLVDWEHVENNGMLEVNKNIKTEINKIVTLDVSRSTNVVNINSDVNKKETNYERDGKLIPMNKINDVSETNTRHRKVSYANILRRS